jgi:hypothetical protein
LTDREFCSEGCRKRGARASASVFHDSEYSQDPYWEDLQAVKPSKQASRTSNATVVGVILGLLGAMGAARVYLPDDSPMGASPLASTAPTTRPGVETNKDAAMRGDEPGWLGWMESYLPGDKPLKAHTDFRAQLKEWAGSPSGWSVQNGVARPGSLRLWKPTLKSENYVFEFQGAVTRKAVSWAYRAKDTHSYYATKIVLNRPGEASGASIVRYGMANSALFARAELPLPIVLHKDRPYRIRMLVEGDRFSTLIDGHLIDEWTDHRLKAGGVGFFAEEGEASAIEWADFRERKGWLSRLVTATLFLPPGMTL